MRLPWLHRDRVEVLSALALVAGEGQALEPGFASLAAQDPALRPWIRRLAGLDQDQDPVGRLHRLRLVDGDEADWLRRRHGTRGFGIALSRVGASGRRVAPGFAFVRYYPLWLLVAITALPLLVWGLIEAAQGHPLQRLYQDLGVRLPALTGFMLDVPWWRQAVTVLIAWIAMAVLLVVWWYEPVVRYAMPLWCPAVFRAASACRLLHHAECGGWLAPDRVERWQRWFERRLHLPGSDPTAPSWRREWRMFWFLTWFMVPKQRRRMLVVEGQQIDLLGRLRVLGMVVDGPQGIDWEATRAQAQARLEDAQRRRHPWLWVVLLLTGFGCFMLAAFLPILTIVRYLGG